MRRRLPIKDDCAYRDRFFHINSRESVCLWVRERNSGETTSEFLLVFRSFVRSFNIYSTYIYILYIYIYGSTRNRSDHANDQFIETLLDRLVACSRLVCNVRRATASNVISIQSSENHKAKPRMFSAYFEVVKCLLERS
jgi:hypothetical protein